MNEGLFSSCINGVSCLAKFWDSPTGSGQEEATQFCITESTRKDASPGGFGWGEVELPLVEVPSPLVLVETLTKSPGGHLCPHTFCPCGFVVEFIFAVFFPPSAKQSEPWGREAYSCGTCISWERIVQGSNPNSVLGTLSVSKQATWISGPHTPYL